MSWVLTHTHKRISQCYRQVKKKIAKLLKWTVKAILEAEEQLLTRSRCFFFLHNLKSNISRHCIQFSSLPSSFNLHAGTKPYANDLQRPSTAVAWEQKFHRLWKENLIETLELGKSFLSPFLPPPAHSHNFLEGLPFSVKEAQFRICRTLKRKLSCAPCSQLYLQTEKLISLLKEE